ncbi:MarR family winged helix-turn-helix transcriptional regulator [Litorihabitans aurantiacus]|uniref:HTH marR-type domain-containing protein n=1 Tax=Litorihabitans aurantiacus TaxID=1930061 RepID=A0AA38CUV8_9MICO|nr:MarR family transcriptional regulator [Litorihabitans aurantiacus]GMA32410.1 hypothetical protein GCM10025875_24020 [Litorihabitans aurantiacus]
MTTADEYPRPTARPDPCAVDVRWLDAGQQRDWRAAVVGMTHLLSRLTRDLEAGTGLSMPEYELLVRLSEAPQRRVRMAELAVSVAHSRSRVTHAVARLERSGLVRREPDGVDRRGVVAVMTEAGFARLEAAAPVHVASVRARLVDVLDREQLAHLGEAMRTVLRAEGVPERPPEVLPDSHAHGEPSQEGLRD